MDPVFGLPCTSDSRAMELARNRNHFANKKLEREFEALDLAQRTRSGKFMSRWSELKDFRSTIEINQPGADKALISKKAPVSMSLKELDKKLNEVKGLKMATDALARSRSHQPADDSGKIKPSSLYKENTTVSLIGAFDDEGRHIVELEDHDKYLLTINRKKHAMREAWDRATSADMQYRASQAQSQRSQDQRSQARFKSRKTKSQDRMISEKIHR